MALSHAIMTALLEDRMSGYELAKSFDTSMGFFWRASHQQIYQELRKLATKGWLSGEQVSQTGRPNKIAYSLTEAGRDALDEWVYGDSRLQESKDDLLIKLHNLSEANAGHLATEIEKRREKMMQRLYLYETIRRLHYADLAELPVRRKGIYLVLAAAIGAGERFLQWCDEALDLLATVNR